MNVICLYWLTRTHLLPMFGCQKQLDISPSWNCRKNSQIIAFHPPQRVHSDSANLDRASDDMASLAKKSPNQINFYVYNRTRSLKFCPFGNHLSSSNSYTKIYHSLPSQTIPSH